MSFCTHRDGFDMYYLQWEIVKTKKNITFKLEVTRFLEPIDYIKKIQLEWNPKENTPLSLSLKKYIF